MQTVCIEWVYRGDFFRPLCVVKEFQNYSLLPTTGGMLNPMCNFICACGSPKGKLVLEAPWVGVRVRKTGNSDDPTGACTSEGSISHIYSNPQPQAGSLLTILCCVSQASLRHLQE